MATSRFIEHVTLSTAEIDRLVRRGQHLRGEAIARGMQRVTRYFGSLPRIARRRAACLCLPGRT